MHEYVCTMNTHTYTLALTSCKHWMLLYRKEAEAVTIWTGHAILSEVERRVTHGSWIDLQDVAHKKTWYMCTFKLYVDTDQFIAAIIHVCSPDYLRKEVPSVTNQGWRSAWSTDAA